MSAYPSSGQDRRVAAEPLRRLVSEVFGRCGMSAKDAALLIGGVERIYVPGEIEVETEEEYELLRKLKCDSVQGFLFARPMPAGRGREVGGIAEQASLE